MLDAPDRCSRIHGRTALHSHRINLTANRIRRIPRYTRSLPSFEPAIRASTSPWRRATNSRTGILQRNFISVPLWYRGSHEVRTIIVPTRSIAISISKQSPRESLRLMRHYIYAARNRGGFLRAERTLCAPLPRILFSERDVFRVPGQRAVSAASLCSPVPMIYAPPCHFNNNNNNSCPICLSGYVSGYLCLGRNRAWCGNGGSLLAKSRGNWMGGVPNGTSFRKLADDQSFIIVAQWINLSGLDKSI